MDSVVVFKRVPKNKYSFKTRNMKIEERGRLEEIIARTNPLIDPLELLRRLMTPNSCISGGAAVYAVGGSSIDVVDDIDIFILNKDKETFLKIYQNIILAFPEVTVFTRKSVVTIFPFHYDGSYNPKIPSFQMIMTNKVCPEYIIHDFDLDYVQCVLHEGNLIRTNYNRRAIRDRTIYFRSKELRCHRLAKAIRKGYSVNSDSESSVFVMFGEGEEGMMTKMYVKRALDRIANDPLFDKYEYLMKIGYEKVLDPVNLTCDNITPITNPNYDIDEYLERKKEMEEEQINYIRRGDLRPFLKPFSNFSKKTSDDIDINFRIVKDKSLFYGKEGCGSSVKACR